MRPRDLAPVARRRLRPGDHLQRAAAHGHEGAVRLEDLRPLAPRGPGAFRDEAAIVEVGVPVDHAPPAARHVVDGEGRVFAGRHGALRPRARGPARAQGLRARPGVREPAAHHGLSRAGGEPDLVGPAAPAARHGDSEPEGQGVVEHHHPAADLHRRRLLRRRDLRRHGDGLEARRELRGGEGKAAFGAGLLDEGQVGPVLRPRARGEVPAADERRRAGQERVQGACEPARRASAVRKVRQGDGAGPRDVDLWRAELAAPPTSEGDAPASPSRQASS